MWVISTVIPNIRIKIGEKKIHISLYIGRNKYQLFFNIKTQICERYLLWKKSDINIINIIQMC